MILIGILLYDCGNFIVRNFIKMLQRYEVSAKISLYRQTKVEK